MAAKSILIAGAGIAGPTLAYWLLRHGFEPVLVERWPEFRSGGYIIDFWGVGFDVAERIGVLPELQAVSYLNDHAVFVRADGSVRSAFGGASLMRALRGRLLSIQRGDLAARIFQTVSGRMETMFGDRIMALHETTDGVDVAFEKHSSRSFDLVIGADGLHSPVRAAMFGSAPESERYLGYCAAAFLTQGYSRRDEHIYLSYAAPGRQISRFALRNDETGFLFVFASPDTPKELTGNAAAQKQIIHNIFGREPWTERNEILAHFDAADSLYFDAVSQIELPRWSQGRVALVGDAAYCPSLLAGEGSAFAMAGAYILAYELALAAGDHVSAFAAYERRFRPFVARKQRAARAFASSLAPRTNLGLMIRDIVLRLGAIPVIADLLMRRFVIDKFELPS